ncbi:MAG TPA: hypothetical protein VKR21_16030 [Solirubrobacteraceae bacterium]|nr:hypothetical protein [Solirubrobacteraceae bacterium]
MAPQHKLRIALLDEEELPVENDNGPIFAEMGVGVAPSPNAPFGTTLTVPIAVGFGPHEFQPSSSYQFKLWLDDETREDWSLGFMTMPEAQSKAA